MNNDDIKTETSNVPTKQARPKIVKLLIASLVTLGLLAYTATVAFAAVAIHSSRLAEAEKVRQQQIVPNEVIRQGLKQLVDTKTVTRTITYRDSIDRSMLVRWDIASDFSNTRAPKSKGVLTVDYLVGQSRHIQKLEFVAVKPKKYHNALYFRMIEGNEYTNASKEWFSVTAYDMTSFGRLSSHQLYQRDELSDIYRLGDTARGFEKFNGFDFSLFNSPAFYLITGDMRDGAEKAKIIDEIRNDKAYVLNDCSKNAPSSWCGGSFNTGGMASITANYATSEGLGTEPGLKFDAARFWLTADNSTNNIRKLEVSNGGGDKFVVEYSRHNEPVSITVPGIAAR
ncbi:MAG TPA: hypothetical protein VK983_02360 [Candidatus Limnocylindrales bacterium]|nr:hypothetical protein [Candidatus Limnocylindrales bacterium]